MGVTPVLTTEALRETVDALTRILGLAPTFVDGERWAQFDVAGRRFCLATPQELGHDSALMVKVEDLHAARAALAAMGFAVGEPIDHGAHELRAGLTIAGAPPIILYSAR